MKNNSETRAVYPCHNDEDKNYNWIDKGLTVREHFACVAMQAILAQTKLDEIKRAPYTHSPDVLNKLTEVAYHAVFVADELVDELEKKEKK